MVVSIGELKVLKAMPPEGTSLDDENRFPEARGSLVEVADLAEDEPRKVRWPANPRARKIFSPVNRGTVAPALLADVLPDRRKKSGRGKARSNEGRS